MPDRMGATSGRVPRLPCPAMTTTHPLDPLGASELEAAVAVLRATGDLTDDRRLISVELVEPSKEDLRRFDDGASLPRQAFAVLLDPGSSATS